MRSSSPEVRQHQNRVHRVRRRALARGFLLRRDALTKLYVLIDDTEENNFSSMRAVQLAILAGEGTDIEGISRRLDALDRHAT